MINWRQNRGAGLGAIALSAFLLVASGVPVLANNGDPAGVDHVLHGNYSVRITGYDDSTSAQDTDASNAVGPGVPLSTAGVLTLDGKGTISAGDLFTSYGYAGLANPGEGCVAEYSATGTYVVNADGTVVITLSLSLSNDTPGGVTDPCSQAVGTTSSAVWAGAETREGKEIDLTGLSPTQLVVSGEMTRLHSN